VARKKTEAPISSNEVAIANQRQRRKSILVLSGTSLSSRI
jgi:hypothetical protein